VSAGMIMPAIVSTSSVGKPTIGVLMKSRVHRDDQFALNLPTKGSVVCAQRLLSGMWLRPGCVLVSEHGVAGAPLGGRGRCQHDKRRFVFGWA
jgi:hypothetical protein